MVLENINHAYAYHTQKIATMFFPQEKISNSGEDAIHIVTAMEQNKLNVRARVFSEERTLFDVMQEGDDAAQKLSVLLYRVLSELTGYVPPWGILYGVRPARLMHATCEALGEQGAREKFGASLVQPQKIDLALQVMHAENSIIALSQEKSYSLYVSVPFCPTRCRYCSFVSHSIADAADLMEDYVSLLCRELQEIAAVAERLSLRLETVYFGGGTPTALSAAQLGQILQTVQHHFDLSHLREYTVEAGRPDTVTAEKLEALRRFGVQRISINPQTFSDAVRQKAGRRHTTAQTVEAFELARACGFDNINMDFIAGLEGESRDSFADGIRRAADMGADSITVHNLALKTAATLAEDGLVFAVQAQNDAAWMVDYARDYLASQGYAPYYMYRQSKSLGNLENVGYAKSGKACLYNVYMMDETHSVLAAGAGAVTKLRGKSYREIERIYNYKYPYEYLRDFDEMLRRKEQIEMFYRTHFDGGAHI